MRANILIVEDDPVVLTYYKHHLKSLEKADITLCSSGAEVISLLETYVPDLVIMDYHLPDITGLELTSRIVMQYPAVIVIAVSGDNRVDLEAEMLEIGAVSFLRKPVNSRVLYLTMQNFVEIVLSRKERKKAETDKTEKKTKPEKKTETIEPDDAGLLMSKAEPKTPQAFFAEIAEDYELVDDFLDSVDAVSYTSDMLYDRMDVESLLETASALDVSGRKLNSIQAFPIVVYSASLISDNLSNLDYKSMDSAPFKKLCVFIYDYTVLYMRWVRSVFRDRTTDDIHYMDFELMGYAMQMESIFYDANVLAESDERTADEGGSVEFF